MLEGSSDFSGGPFFVYYVERVIDCISRNRAIGGNETINDGSSRNCSCMLT